jgi:hypothetical protein
LGCPFIAFEILGWDDGDGDGDEDTDDEEKIVVCGLGVESLC